MKALVIDSHKGSEKLPSNLHALNAKIIADSIGAKMIWSYPSVNDNIESNFDLIVFNHASHYAYVDYSWVEQSPNARLVYVSNEYNLGEPRCLWMAIKRAGRRYEVIANHESNISKIVTKYTDAWHVVNLNSLIFDNDKPSEITGEGSIYWGSYRKGREKYFKKYFDGMTVSTHSKNKEKFAALGVAPNYVKRIQISDLQNYRTSLYIEDEINHENYHHVANRFYEALNNNVVMFFDENCRNTVEKSVFKGLIPDFYFVDSKEDFAQKSENLPDDAVNVLERCRIIAGLEKQHTVNTIKNILTTS